MIQHKASSPSTEPHLEFQQPRLHKFLRKESTGAWLAVTDDGKFGFLPEYELLFLRKEGFEEQTLAGQIVELSVEKEIGSSFNRLSRSTVLYQSTTKEFGRVLTVEVHTVVNNIAFASVGSVFDGALKVIGRKFVVGEQVSVVIAGFSKKHRTFRLKLLHSDDLSDLPSTSSASRAQRNRKNKRPDSPPNNPFSGLKELLGRQS